MSVLEKPKPLRITRPTVIPQPPKTVRTSGIRQPSAGGGPKPNIFIQLKVTVLCYFQIMNANIAIEMTSPVVTETMRQIEHSLNTMTEDEQKEFFEKMKQKYPPLKDSDAGVRRVSVWTLTFLKHNINIKTSKLATVLVAISATFLPLSGYIESGFPKNLFALILVCGGFLLMFVAAFFFYFDTTKKWPKSIWRGLCSAISWIGELIARCITCCWCVTTEERE
ncbi:unnamed protein product [Caenorhabditis brenneri]